MALSGTPQVNTTATVAAAGTSVSPATAMPDNAFGVIVVNPSGSETVWVAVGAPGGALGAATATRVRPGQTVYIPYGTQAVRGIMDEAQQAGSGLIIDATAALVVELTYLCVLGTPGC